MFCKMGYNISKVWNYYCYGLLPQQEKMSFSPLELSRSSKTVFSTEAHDLQNDRTNRKGKRLRRSTDTQSIVFAKDIAGHRWDEDIDSLLAFINSSDQNLERVAAESINSLENVDLLPKSSVHKVQDTKKYKVLSKEGKNGPNCKPKINCEKSSEDHRTCVSSGNENLSDSIGRIQDEASRKSKTCGTSFGNFNLEKVPKSKSVDNTSSFIPGSIFESEHQGGIKTGMMDSNIITSNSNEAVLIHNNIQSDFVEDFYSITEAVYDYVEETEFKVVMKKKKHKNKHLPKKSCDVSQKCSCTSEIKKQYPDKLAKQASCNDLVLKLPIQPRGRQDGSHQKSFSSVPPSEHSSSENSDLDSVHSLPVWGSGPPPTFSYPQTTHSSFSCTPRASYADIVCKSVNPSESKSRLYGSLTDRDIKSGVSQPSLQKKFGVDSKLFENGHCLIPNNQPHTITEEGCISSGIACSKANLHSKYSDLYNSGISETGLITNNGNSHVLEGNPNLCNHPTTDESVTSNSTIGNELVISNQPETLYREQEKVAANIPGQQTKNRSECPPVIIMDNYIPKGCVCDISFGFEVNEQLLCTTLGNNYSKVTKRLNSDLRIPSAVCTAIPDNVVGSLSFSSIIPPDSSVNDELCEDLKCNKVVTHLDHSIKWQDSTLDVDTFNYNQIVNFFGSTWKKALNDYQQGSKNSNKASKVRFYTEQ
ncbi:uncharacterized protein LOC143241019 isoform X2 [Tachypleus tridentatus]|uniref:uncharacterized protein LOC143241019 isoform X2 n=1 Tax=Tachypleus tridentatus TaxID=6853 RepID=UPI003FD56EEF